MVIRVDVIFRTFQRKLLSAFNFSFIEVHKTRTVISKQKRLREYQGLYKNYFKTI